MAALDFPRHRVPSLHDLATQLLDSRKVGSADEAFARELLGGFYEICTRAGLDRLLDGLQQKFADLDVTERAGFADDPRLRSAVVAQLAKIDVDGGGPRNAKPGLIADCVVAALGLTVVDEVPRPIAIDGAVRSDVIAAIASVVHPALAVPQIRDTIVARARALCEPHYHAAFEKIVTALDERAMRMLKQPKVPIDAMQAVQRVLADARAELIERISRTAIDRAVAVIAAASPEAAARIDQPITLRSTPREVAILRAADARVPKLPAPVADSLFESLTELAQLAWRAPEQVVRAYSASQTFAVGDVLEHPKFGRGTVTASAGQRIDVEFADGPHTLVHRR